MSGDAVSASLPDIERRRQIAFRHELGEWVESGAPVWVVSSLLGIAERAGASLREAVALLDLAYHDEEDWRTNRWFEAVERLRVAARQEPTS